MIKKNKEILGFNDTWLMLIGIPVVGILMALLMFGDFDGDVDIFSCLWKCTIISIFYVVIYWMIFRQIFIYFRQIFPENRDCLLYTSPSPRDATLSRMPSSA